MSSKIQPACPACGSCLFLGSDGWLTCSYLKCQDPTLAARLLIRERRRREELVRHQTLVEYYESRDPLKGEEFDLNRGEKLG